MKKYAIHNFTYRMDEPDQDDADEPHDDEDGDFGVYDTEKSAIGYFVIASCDTYWKARLVRDALNVAAKPQGE